MCDKQYEGSLTLTSLKVCYIFWIWKLVKFLKRSVLIVGMQSLLPEQDLFYDFLNSVIVTSTIPLPSLVGL